MLRGHDWSPLDRVIDGHVSRLRRKVDFLGEEEPRLTQDARRHNSRRRSHAIEREHDLRLSFLRIVEIRDLKIAMILAAEGTLGVIGV